MVLPIETHLSLLFTSKSGLPLRTAVLPIGNRWSKLKSYFVRNKISLLTTR